VKGSFEYALNEIVEEHLDMSEFDKRYSNDDTGRPVYDPRILLKVVLYGYYKGLISSRARCTTSRRWPAGPGRVEGGALEAAEGPTGQTEKGQALATSGDERHRERARVRDTGANRVILRARWTDRNGSTWGC
jgi:Transposase domain (DUF772)